MNRQRGFTLIELMVTVAILGILSATSMHYYQTWRDRARGAEAAVMIKQIIDAEIAYFLENNAFFPPVDTELLIPSQGDLIPSDQDLLRDIETKLHLDISRGRQLDYTWNSYEDTDVGKFINVIIESSPGSGIFKGGSIRISGFVYENGNIEFFHE